MEVICEGADKDIGKLIEWCKRGLQGAVVERVEFSVVE